MKKNQGRKLRLAKETIRNLVPAELRQVGGGRISCGGATACDCSGPFPSSGSSIASVNCTPNNSIMQY
jgi:hypothetical protein